MGDENIVYENPLREGSRRVLGRPVPADTNYVVVETVRGMTSVYYQKRNSEGELQTSFDVEQFKESLQETIISHFVKLHPEYTEDES